VQFCHLVLVLVLGHSLVGGFSAGLDAVARLLLDVCFLAAPLGQLSLRRRQGVEGDHRNLVFFLQSSVLSPNFFQASFCLLPIGLRQQREPRSGIDGNLVLSERVDQLLLHWVVAVFCVLQLERFQSEHTKETGTEKNSIPPFGVNRRLVPGAIASSHHTPATTGTYEQRGNWKPNLVCIGRFKVKFQSLTHVAELLVQRSIAVLQATFRKAKFVDLSNELFGMMRSKLKRAS
jgi:hypothetical protein